MAPTAGIVATYRLGAGSNRESEMEQTNRKPKYAPIAAARALDRLIKDVPVMLTARRGAALILVAAKYQMATGLIADAYASLTGVEVQ